MDITRNWRLKTSRSQLIATRCPKTGELALPQQNGVVAQPAARYTFEDHQAQAVMAEAAYAKAAR